MLAYILSQPRSGSTVLTAMLDKRKGVVCMPESSFPQALGVVSRKERDDRRWMAALYLGSTFPPTPLSFEDALACMEGSDEQILHALGRALATKIGRDPTEVRTIVWKTTRTIGMHRGPLSTSGRFIVLRRHPHNVFESQSRFDYGVRNRRPLRYAFFAQSYEYALSRLPVDRTFLINYDDAEKRLSELLGFLQLDDRGTWETGSSSLDLVAKSCSWLAQITEEFRNTDVEKRARLTPETLKLVDRSLALTRPLRSFMGPVRAHSDRRSMSHIWDFARQRLAENS
ncbi:sulfotransferase [Luteolibacter soli]|uniref:Sulfotransferase n=1 Tax=Luteolibacter soli TaxID=3135280 RepID=A0ABU9AUL4_9BACT